MVKNMAEKELECWEIPYTPDKPKKYDCHQWGCSHCRVKQRQKEAGEVSNSSQLLACAEYHEFRAAEPLLTLETMEECSHKEDLKKCLPIWKAKSKAKHLKWAKLLRDLATS